MLRLACFALIILLLQGALMSQETTHALQIDPLPRPAADQNQYLGFAIRAPWMDGHLRVRFPEDVNSSLGRHFLDNLQPELPRVSVIEYPEWRREADGTLAYDVVTSQGLSWHGAVKLAADGETIQMRMRMRNGSGQALTLNSQVCYDFTPSRTFGDRNSVAETFIWHGGKPLRLADATPMTKYNRTGYYWLLALTRPTGNESIRAIEDECAWWIIDQRAEHDLIWRETRDKAHLTAITWDHTTERLMTNTNIPCLHSDPLLVNDLADGAEAVWTGRIYVMANDPTRLLAKYQADRKPQE